MAVKNLGELGINLQEIYSRLLANQNLCKLLHYTDKDPLSQDDIADTTTLLGKEIKIVPVVGTVSDATCTLGMVVLSGTPNENNEYTNIELNIGVYVPLTQWIIKGTNFRIFSILGEIRNSLMDKTINGLGKLKGGRFSYEQITDEVACYSMYFIITEYA